MKQAPTDARHMRAWTTRRPAPAGGTFLRLIQQLPVWCTGQITVGGNAYTFERLSPRRIAVWPKLLADVREGTSVHVIALGAQK